MIDRSEYRSVQEGSSPYRHMLRMRVGIVEECEISRHIGTVFKVI